LYTILKPTTTAVEEYTNSIPTTIALLQNYPNPFNPATTITFELPSASHVSLRVYNLLGQEIGIMVDGMQTAGVHRVTFDASRCSSGVYLFQLKVGATVQTRKMLLLK
jgi:hypothetical protein